MTLDEYGKALVFEQVRRNLHETLWGIICGQAKKAENVTAQGSAASQAEWPKKLR